MNTETKQTEVEVLKSLSSDPDVSKLGSTCQMPSPPPAFVWPAS